MKLKMNRMGIGFLAVVATTVAGVGLSSGEAEAQTPPDVQIKSITFRGAGCPEGTAHVQVTEDKKAFVASFDEFQVSAGPGVPLSESLKGCTATITLSFPAGWSWTVSDIAYLGSAQLDAGVVGRFSARLSFPGQLPVSKEVRMPGPTPIGGKDFALKGTYDIFAWSPCGLERPMTALATAQVDNSSDRSRSGLVRVSDQTGDFRLIFYIQWKHC